MIGKTIIPICGAVPKISFAIGTPPASVFFEPQKTVAISSSLLNPSARAAIVVPVSATASRIAAPANVSSSISGPCFVQSPSWTESANDENTSSRMTALSKPLMYFLYGRTRL